MRINFRQGVVSHQAGGFLSINPSGHVDVLASNRPVTVSVAHQQTNYTHIENNTVANAWLGPFSASIEYWLYWDFNPLTFERTFGITNLEPVAQSVEPGGGNPPIVGVIVGGSGVGSFIVDEHFVISPGRIFAVQGSTGNDGTYTVATATFSGISGQTTIVVNESVVDATADGELTLDIDSYGEPLRQDNRHWYDTVNNKHFVWSGTMWGEVLRVFAAHLTNGNTFIPQTITGGSFIGTQIGDTSSIQSGRVLFDESSNPLRRDNGTFFTTEDQFFSSAARVDALRLESNVVRAQFPFDSAIAQFSVVAWQDDGKAQLAQYDDIGTTVVGILTEDVLINEVGAVIIQGVITNPDWGWTSGVDAVPVGTPLWVDNGILVSADPHVLDAITYPIGRVPIARVLGDDTIVFEQGLGGKGDQGPPGSIEDIPPATTTELGGVTLTVPSSIPELAIVPSDLDPRLSDARSPLPHTHDATDVTFTPGGGIVSNNVEGALLELGNGKVNKSGDIMTGFLTLNANPTAALHAVPKQYVDGLVSGLVWLDPICLVNMIDDTLTTPPITPETSDAYIVPPGATGAWAAIAAGHVVVWDGATWLDRGPVTGFSPTGARFGISMTSTTVAGGSFVGQENNIAQYDPTGVLTGFEIPSSNNAVYVCNSSSLHAFNQFAFSGTDWVLFGGGAAVGPDGVTTVQTGNVLSVKQFADGGVNDVQFWQGLEPSDLALLYAPITHTHTGADVTITPYITSLNWGSPFDVTTTQLNSTTAQLALEELMDEKASKTPIYTDLVDLPSAANVHGMVAHVHNEGKLYFSHAGSWVALCSENDPISIPYDISFFIAGNMFTASAIVGSFIATRAISIPANAVGSFVFAQVAPLAPVVYDIQVNGLSVGSITFLTGIQTGTFTLPGTGSPLSDLDLVAGDIISIVNPLVTEPTIADVTITIVGCADATPC